MTDPDDASAVPMGVDVTRLGPAQVCDFLLGGAHNFAVDRLGDVMRMAQTMLDRHVSSSVNGRCVECGVPGPCDWWETAAGVFFRLRCLPRRIPGLSRPELVGARRLPLNSRAGVAEGPPEQSPKRPTRR